MEEQISDGSVQNEHNGVVMPPLQPLPPISQPSVWDSQEAILHPPQTHQPQLDEDLQTAKKIVSFSITLIMIVSLAYAGFVLFDGDALTGYRPGDAALDSQRV